MKNTVLSVLFSLLLCGLAMPLHAESLKVTEMAVTTRVAKGKSVDSVHRISYRSVRKLYCFTSTVSDDAEETVLRHVWLREGKAVKESEMSVKGKKWRVYSTLHIDSSRTGQWKVEARDGNNTVLKSVTFRVH